MDIFPDELIGEVISHLDFGTITSVVVPLSRRFKQCYYNQPKSLTTLKQFRYACLTGDIVNITKVDDNQLKSWLFYGLEAACQGEQMETILTLVTKENQYLQEIQNSSTADSFEWRVYHRRATNEMTIFTGTLPFPEQIDHLVVIAKYGFVLSCRGGNIETWTNLLNSPFFPTDLILPINLALVYASMYSHLDFANKAVKMGASNWKFAQKFASPTEAPQLFSYLGSL